MDDSPAASPQRPLRPRLLPQLQPSRRSRTGVGRRISCGPRRQPWVARRPPPHVRSPAAPATSSQRRRATRGGVRASPAAQRVAAREGVDLTRVAGHRPRRRREQARRRRARRSSRPLRPPPGAGIRPSGCGRRTRNRLPHCGPSPTAAHTAAAAGTRETREKMSTRRKRIAEKSRCRPNTPRRT